MDVDRREESKHIPTGEPGVVVVLVIDPKTSKQPTPFMFRECCTDMLRLHRYGTVHALVETCRLLPSTSMHAALKAVGAVNLKYLRLETLPMTLWEDPPLLENVPKSVTVLHLQVPTTGSIMAASTLSKRAFDTIIFEVSSTSLVFTLELTTLLRLNCRRVVLRCSSRRQDITLWRFRMGESLANIGATGFVNVNEIVVYGGVAIVNVANSSAGMVEPPDNLSWIVYGNVIACDTNARHTGRRWLGKMVMLPSEAPKRPDEWIGQYTSDARPDSRR
jgi:hypothetical protein